MLNSSHSQEKVIVQGVFQDKHKFDENPEVQNVLSDFDSLDFSGGPFNHHLYDMNYKVKRQIHLIK